MDPLSVSGVAGQTVSFFEKQQLMGKLYASLGCWIATLGLLSMVFKNPPLAILNNAALKIGLSNSWIEIVGQWLDSRSVWIQPAAWLAFASALVFSGGISAYRSRAPITVWVLATILIQLGTPAGFIILAMAARVLADLILERTVQNMSDYYPSAAISFLALVMPTLIAPWALAYWFVAEPAPLRFSHQGGVGDVGTGV